MKFKKVAGKDKGTIIFIHGISSSRAIFENAMHSPEITLTKIAVDLPGHGENKEGHSKNDFKSESYIKKLITFINLIDDDIILVGNSMGGHLAIEITPKINRLKSLVIFGTPPLKKPINFNEAFIEVPALHTFLTENPTDAEIKEAVHVAVFNSKNAFKLIEDFKKTVPKVRSTMAEDIMNNNFEDQEQIFINLPVKKFIIAGKQDPSVNASYIEEICNKCNGDCELIVFNECGHYPSLEKPEEFNNAIQYVVSQTC